MCKKGIDVTVPILTGTLCLLMSHLPFASSSSSIGLWEDDDLLIYAYTSPSSDLPSSTAAQPPITQVYYRRQQPTTLDPASVPPPPASCHAPVPSSSDPDPSSSDDLPIALRKGKRQCTYPISSFVSYNHLSLSSYSFVASLDSVTIPTTVHEVLSHPGWLNIMVEEMNALDDNDIWTLVHLPACKKAIACKCVFAVKVNSDGTLLD